MMEAEEVTAVPVTRVPDPNNSQEGAAGISVRSGVTRRQVLTHGAALGLGIPLTGGLLEACSSSARGADASNGSKGIVVGLDTDIDTLDPISFRSPAAYETVIQAYEMPVDNRVQPADAILDGVAGTLIPDVAIRYSIAADSAVY